MGHSPPMIFWNSLSNDDKSAYIALKDAFHGNSSVPKVRHQATFHQDLSLIHSYIERRTDQSDIRSIVCGIYFGGKFICVNTRQLKYLLGRCKSSINNGLQQLGYISAKNRIKPAIVTVLPALLHESNILRQWTLRCSENDSTPALMSSRPIMSTISKLVTHRPPPRNLPTPIINMKVIPRIDNEYDSSNIIKNDSSDLFMFDSIVSDPIKSFLPRPLSTPLSEVQWASGDFDNGYESNDFSNREKDFPQAMDWEMQ